MKLTPKQYAVLDEIVDILFELDDNNPEDNPDLLQDSIGKIIKLIQKNV